MVSTLSGASSSAVVVARLLRQSHLPVLLLPCGTTHLLLRLQMLLRLRQAVAIFGARLTYGVALVVMPLRLYRLDKPADPLVRSVLVLALALALATRPRIPRATAAIAATTIRVQPQVPALTSGATLHRLHRAPTMLDRRVPVEGSRTIHLATSGSRITPSTPSAGPQRMSSFLLPVVDSHRNGTDNRWAQLVVMLVAALRATNVRLRVMPVFLCLRSPCPLPVPSRYHPAPSIVSLGHV